jgi:hypothetical protein
VEVSYKVKGDNMQEQVTPVHIMKEVERLMGKLKEANLTNIDLVVTRDTKVVEDQLVIRWTLGTDKVKVAQYTHIDPRPIAEIKAEAQAQKQAIEAQVVTKTAELDEIIAVEPTV